ncbi:MAG: hypothetical protein Q8P30_03340 [Candidatus Uhrbacteria bacterium]|nr:hypothetical protein [Candidatus Uhrbacteria bacterium]
MKLKINTFQALAGVALVVTSVLIISSSTNLNIYGQEFNVNIINAEPTIESVKVNLDGSINSANVSLIRLSAGENSDYYVIAEIQDLNSIFDIVDVRIDMYRSGVNNAQQCKRDVQNCFHLSLRNEDCTLEPMSVIDGVVVCKVELPYWTDATFGHKSIYESEVWKVRVVAEDTDSALAEDANYENEVGSLLAVRAVDEFTIGNVLPGSSSKNGVLLEFENVGNVEADFRIRSSDLECAIGIIPAENQRLDVANGSYEDMLQSETSILLDGSDGSDTGLVLSPRSTKNDSVGTVYHTLEVPLGVKGPCSGENVITGI